MKQSGGSWSKGKASGASLNSPIKSPRSFSIDTSGDVTTEDSEQVKAVDSFANVIERVATAALVLSNEGSVQPTGELVEGLRELPVSDPANKALLSQVGRILVEGETQRAQVLSELNADFSIPMKQFLRVDVAGIHEMQERLEQARNSLEEAQLRYDIARSTNKKKAMVEKLNQELTAAKRQHGLLKMNLSSKMLEFESRQKYDSLQRLFKFFSAYGEMFEAMHREYSQVASAVKGSIEDLERRKAEWEVERSRLSVSDILQDEFEVDISRQGYVEAVGAPLGQSFGRLKKMWMVASQGTLFLYQSWKDEAPKTQVDLVLCSVKSEGNSDTLTLTSPQEMYQIKCQTAAEADMWMNVIKKSISYKLRLLQEEKRRNDPNAPPDYLKEMQMLSMENKLCADCGTRSPEWASMTLGVIVCDECSGVHRQLGVHVSRVRSLTIDMWVPEQYYVFKQMGNAFANPIWEHKMVHDKAVKRLGAQKLTPKASREDRDIFIRAKYVEKRWLQPIPPLWLRGSRTGPLKLVEKLYDFGSRNEVPNMFLALAHGADPAELLESGMSVFHQLVCDGSADVYSLQLLMLFSSGLHQKNATGFNALHLAAHHNRAAYCKFLVNNGFDEAEQSMSGRTALDLAREANALKVLTFFETGEVPEDSQAQVEQLQQRAMQLISRLEGKLQAEREKLQGFSEDDAEAIFESAKRIRMFKLGIQQIEKEVLTK